MTFIPSEKQKLVIELSKDFTQIISLETIYKNGLGWGSNGVGDRFGNFNYTVVYANETTKGYMNDETYKIPSDILKNFLENKENKGNKKGKTIIGIFIHSIAGKKTSRPIRDDIKKFYNSPCVVCGSKSDLCCDHKNDLYNDERVLNTTTQVLDDFQSLCTHCNLQKRQVSKKEKEMGQLYSAKNIPSYNSPAHNFEFPWEKMSFNEKDINCKTGTYWHDPVEFNRKIGIYSITISFVREIKNKNKVDHQIYNPNFSTIRL
jgi:hypothetical protein